MQGSIISDNKDLLIGNYLTSEESSLNILDPPSLYVENNYIELLNIYLEGVSVHYALNKTPTRDDSVLDKSTLLPSNGNYYFKAFGEEKESVSSIYKIDGVINSLNFQKLENSPFDGTNWTGAYGNGIYVVANGINSDQYIYYSTDGINFLPSNIENLTISSIDNTYYCNNIFYIQYRKKSNGSRYTIYSLDGINWAPLTFFDEQEIPGFVFKDQKYYTIAGSGEYNKTYYSDDGINWIDSGNSVNLKETYYSFSNLTYGQGKFICSCSSQKSIFYSSDGLVYEEKQGQELDNIKFTNNKFVALCDYKPYYSYNGIDWYPCTNIPSISFKEGIFYGNNYFACSEGAVSGAESAISSNGVDWRLIPLEDTNWVLILNDKLYVSSGSYEYYCQL